MATACALIAAVGYAVFLSESHRSSRFSQESMPEAFTYSIPQAQTTKIRTTARSTYRLSAVTPRHLASTHGTRITCSLTTAARLPLQSVLLELTPAPLCPLGSSQMLHAFGRPLVSTLLSQLGWPHLPWEFSYTLGFVMHRSRGRYSGYCSCTEMALEWVGGTHPQNARDSETAIHASSSQCRLICRTLVVRFTQRDCHNECKFRVPAAISLERIHLSRIIATRKTCIS